MQDPVPTRQCLAVFAVTAADHADHRNIAAQAVAHNALVAGGNPFIGEFQIAQGIVFMHVHASVVEHQVRLIQGQQVIERLVDHLQVLGITIPIGRPMSQSL